MLVPGNHDIDRRHIDQLHRTLLGSIRSGSLPLSNVGASRQQRGIFHRKFRNYSRFAAAYDLPFNHEFRALYQKSFQLEQGLEIRFLGLNSSFLSSDEDRLGLLMLGPSQYVVPLNKGSENVILCHHPLEWLSDGDEASDFIFTRSRLFVTGHKHNRRVHAVMLSDGSTCVRIESGALSPPRNEQAMGYSFNFIEISDSSPTAGNFRVNVWGRVWDTASTRFVPRPLPHATDGCEVFDVARRGTIGSNNISHSSSEPCPPTPSTSDCVDQSRMVDDVLYQPLTDPGIPKLEPDTGGGVSLLRLAFFRELNDEQRTEVLSRCGIITEVPLQETSPSELNDYFQAMLDNSPSTDITRAIGDVSSAL